MKKIAVFIASIVFVLSGFFLSPAPLALANSTLTPATTNTTVEAAIDRGCSATVNPLSAICVLDFYYGFILQPSFTLVGLAANILDFFLGYSLDSNAYKGEFVAKGWALIRDISNVAFIFTLLYLAIKHILGSSSKKYIPTLIIVALLLNFSLFFTKIVIDAGNILARAFYNSIVIENDAENAGYKSITYGLVDKINPQKLLSTSMFQQNSGMIGEFDSSLGEFQGEVTPDVSGNTGTIFAVLLLVTVVHGFLIVTFLSVALVFVGRVIGLWFAMIFSPIAFITLAVPNLGGALKQLSFDAWINNVLKLSFVAPIFIFFIYLTISFLTFWTTSEVSLGGASGFVSFMEIFIPFVFIIVLLNLAKKTAGDMAGDFGAKVKEYVGKAAGVVAGGALGATSFAARATVGRLAGKALDSGDYEKRIADAKGLNKARLMFQRSSLKKINESSLDIRNAGKAKGITGWASRGVGAGLSAGMTSFGGDKFTAGKGSDQTRKKYEDDKEKSKLELAKDLSSVSDSEKKEIEERAKVYKERIGNEEKELKVIKKEGDDIDERLKELNKPGFKSEKDKKEISDLQAKKEELKIKVSQKEKSIEAIKESDEFKDKIMSVDDEKKRRRDEYARTVEEGWIKGVFNPYNIATGNAKQTADKIRKLKDESKKEKAEKAAREYMEEQQKEKDKEKEGGEDDKKDEKSKDEDKK